MSHYTSEEYAEAKQRYDPGPAEAVDRALQVRKASGYPVRDVSHRLCSAISDLHPALDRLETQVGHLTERLSEVLDVEENIAALKTDREGDRVSIVDNVLGIRYRIEQMTELIEGLQARIVV